MSHNSSVLAGKRTSQHLIPDTTVTMATQGIERIVDSLGYLVLTEDGAVIASGGDLENDETRANEFMKILDSTLKLKKATSDRRDAFRRLTVIWGDFMYVMTISAHKVYVSKRHYSPQDAVPA